MVQLFVRPATLDPLPGGGLEADTKVFAIGAIVTFLLNLVACGVFIHILSGIGK